MFGRATIRLGIGPHSSLNKHCGLWTRGLFVSRQLHAAAGQYIPISVNLKRNTPFLHSFPFSPLHSSHSSLLFSCPSPSFIPILCQFPFLPFLLSFPFRPSSFLPFPFHPLPSILLPLTSASLLFFSSLPSPPIPSPLLFLPWNLEWWGWVRW